MGSGLVRISVAAGARRADLALPATVPLAELVPELARCLGVLAGGATGQPAGVSIATADGRALTLGQSLSAQGVGDGSILVLAAARLPPPRIHDDPSEAMAEAVEQYVAGWPGWAARPAALIAAALLLATALGVVLRPVAEHAPVVGRCVVAATALLVLAGGLFPRWAVAVVVRTTPEGPVDRDRTRSDARAAHAVLLVMLGVTGSLLVAVAPLTAGLGPWGAPLVLDAAGVLVLRTRHHRSGAEVLACVVAALAAVLGAVTVSAHLHPQAATRIAVLLAVGAAGVLAGSVLPASARRARAVELLEGVVLVALLPLLVAATGLLPWVRTVVAR